MAAASRGGGRTGIERALAAALCRAGAAVTEAGCGHRILNQQELAAAVAESCYPSGVDSGATPKAADMWRTWQAMDLGHRTWRLTGWPRVYLSDLHETLATQTLAQYVVTSVTLRRSAYSGPPVVDGLVRVVAPVGELPEVARRTTKALRKAGASASILDGQQGDGTYASAPTAGSVA